MIVRLLLAAIFLCGFAGPLFAQAEKLDALNVKVAEFYQAGRFADAEPVAREALGVAETLFGPQDSRTVAPLSNLAFIYQARGKYPDATQLFKRCLAIVEGAVGPKHKDVGTLLNNIAELHRLQGQFAEAEPLYKRAIAIYEDLGNADHTEMATVLNNLGLVHQAQGHYAEAEPLYKRSFAIYEKVLGKEHPVLATVLNNLAEFYRFQGRPSEAEPYYRQSLAIYEKALGADRVEVARTLNNLSLLYLAEARYADAEPLFKRSLATYVKTVGPDHVEVGTVHNNLGELYREQKRYGEAEQSYTLGLAVYEKVYGTAHSDIARTLNNIALLYHEQGRFADAEPIYLRSSAMYEATLGKGHPEVALSLNNLGEIFRVQGRHDEAESHFKRSVQVYETALGQNAPAAARPINNLATLYYDQRRYADAEALYQRSLKILETVLPPTHPEIARSLLNLATVYQAQQREAEAIALKRRVEAMPGWEVADIPVFFTTNRTATGTPEALKFGSEQLLDISQAVIGEAVLRAPKSEVMNRAQRNADALGQLQKAGGRQTSETTLTLHRVTVARDGATSLLEAARKRAERSARFPKHALVFVHGYNNTFDDAVRRAAMISFDLDFDGITAAFAWPARSGLTAYLGDRERAQTAAPFLTQMLEMIGKALPGFKVHIISHSTGSEVVLTALEKLADRSEGGARVQLGEVIFAHADVNVSRLTQLSSSLRKLGIRVTSYSSKEDLAMRASDLVRMDGKRVGGAPVHLASVDAIDISGLGERFSLNHTIFVQNPLVFNDMARLMATGVRPPDARTPQFKKVVVPQGTHWEFQAPMPAPRAP